ncbi:MAG: class I SAM-dependent methyltransferase [Parcubacteria group bacterium]
MEKKVVDLWKNWWKVWTKIGPPWRPSKKDIGFWEKRIEELSKNKKLKVLLLGSTPEIRDMFARHDIPLTLLEANESMYEAMGKMRKVHSAPSDEKLVIGNWLEADRIFKENRFDIVISDLPHCNIAYKDWPKFFTNIFNVLKPGGQFLLATVTYGYPERQTIEEMLEKYSKNKKYFADFKNRIWELYQVLNEPGILDKKEWRFNLYKLRELVKKKAKKKFSLDEIDRNLVFIQGDLTGELLNDVVEVGPPLEEQLIMQSKWFYLDSLYLVPDHPVFKIRRTMILKVKK